MKPTLNPSNGGSKPTPSSVELQDAWFLQWVMPLCRAFVAVLFVFFGPVRIRRRRRIPKSGGLIIVANHRSLIDPILIQYGCWRPIYFMAMRELFEMGAVGNLARRFKAFPVTRGEADRAAIRRAIETARMGEVVCIFPEGGIADPEQPEPLKPGIALILRKAEVPVIACRVRNSERMIPKSSKIPRPAFRWVTADWSEPVDLRHASTDEILAWCERELRS